MWERDKIEGVGWKTLKDSSILACHKHLVLMLQLQTHTAFNKIQKIISNSFENWNSFEN